MVVVPNGQFKMGSPDWDAERYIDEGPQHVVAIAHQFAVGKFDITVGEFAAFVSESGYDAGSSCYIFVLGSPNNFMGRGGYSWRNPGFSQSASNPVTCVNWRDANAYAQWISKRVGADYRLLTEAEWEYMARGRTSSSGIYTKYFYGDNDGDMYRYGNGIDQATLTLITYWSPGFRCNDGYVFTSPVGAFAPNPFGIYDVHGNVLQWVEDCHTRDYRGAPIDGSAWLPQDCTRRVLRGGSWANLPRALRDAF
jgi:formylglycine-generating enzyme required for sulfatase activity